MPKEKKLFDDDSEEEVSFITENEYAKKYDSWREKEEIHKLEQKYGSKALSSDASETSDSEDDDEPPEVSEETETQFLKTLALLKTKDPRIYDPGYKFFEDEQKEKEKHPTTKTLTFEDSDDDDEDNDGNIFKVEKKAEILNEKEPEPSEKESISSKKIFKEGKLKDYLTGRVEHVDREVEQDLAPLKALWSDPKLNEGEAFLRDYILNQRYLEDGEGEADKLRDDEDLEEDERRVEEQGKFERAYNFRFEEPDEEYLKRFPRTMNSIRPKDDRRSRKRAEVRTRKEEEKKRKMEEIARLKALKLKEIQEKIAKIKEVTGNQELAFKDDDLEGDFDPEQHDKRMQAIFDEQYYGEADGEKPVFPDLDEELEIENWENYEPEHDQNVSRQQNDEPHCEDEDFNMDADYDPKQARISLHEQIQSTLTKKPRNRKKKSKLAELLSKEKPKYVPTVADKTYSQYMEEYYKLDCEDVIGGDLPTRFKYRDVVANDYGLTIEEILLADDKELTQWVPLKRIVRHRPADIEKSEVNTYAQRAADVRLKKKILPSLFKDLPEEPEIVVPVETSKKKKKKKKNKKKEEVKNNDNAEQLNGDDIEHNQNEDSQVVDVNEDSTEVKTEKKKKKRDKGIEDMIVEDVNTTVENNKESSEPTIKQKKKKHKDVKINPEIKPSNTEVNVEELKPKQNSVEIINNTQSTKQSKNKNKIFNTEVNIEQLKPKQNTVAVKNNTEAIKQNKNKLFNTELNLKELKPKEINVEIQNNTEATKQNKKKKKIQKIDGFTVETIQKEEPSQGSQLNNFIGNKQNKKAILKRKLDTNNSQTPNKKKKTDFTNKKDKTKFKQKDKFKNKQGKDKTSDNPLNNLSDERLKAYGLNPKKYRSFLKYKKF